MWTLHQPTEAEIITYLLGQREEPFSYAEVGATRGTLPAGYNVDRHRVLLGHGREVFERARQATLGWRMFPEEFCTLCFPDRPVAAGTVVAVRFRAGPLWTLNPCRVVYTCDEQRDGRRTFGFAYGTLPDHAECGEERFAVEWDEGTGAVWYDLLAFSKPRHPLAAWCFPYARYVQRQFRHMSGEAMQRAVRASAPGLRQADADYDPTEDAGTAARSRCR